ncbi:MAG TPA: M1 family metallopeptidase [Longimicrobium sp.]|jgi:aminopeptidase N|uniref:M1 family metallopeptidase n=1 Tax=Longimicrobium sp. TaxID=2029185 RepID=UPI002ED7E346
MTRTRIVLAALAAVLTASTAAQAQRFTRADSLRGSIGPARAWWDVAYYDLNLTVSPADSSVRGFNGITYRVLQPAREMQIDLQGLQVDSIVQDGRRLRHRRDGDALFVTLAAPQTAGALKTVTVHYHGEPRVARNAPWDGGFVWTRDPGGDPWIATAVQGLGASAWWPNKDTQADEPDSMRIAVTVPRGMTNVSNGRLRDSVRNADGSTTYAWFVTSPINNYGVAVNAGSYAHFQDVFQGEKGPLTLDYWPLAMHEQAARRQWGRDVKPMLQCFESWFGPFPWYEDGFKLVETPHLGMEHQSAVAYGNGYRNGYRGQDLSGTGRGLSWDYIIIHEAGHEWFGNHITTKDIADMWVHEGFTTYSEGLFVECQQGKAAGAEYVLGQRKQIRNDAPMVGPYGVNTEGSGDMYFKGANLLHTVRHVIGDDAKWRGILRGLNATFGRQTVTGAQVTEYISREAGMDLSRVFRQYLTTTRIPELEYRIQGNRLSYRWTNVAPDFDMPVRVTLAPGEYGQIAPTTSWQTANVRGVTPANFRVDENFYVTARNAGAPGRNR